MVCVPENEQKPFASHEKSTGVTREADDGNERGSERTAGYEGSPEITGIVSLPKHHEVKGFTTYAIPY